MGLAGLAKGRGCLSEHVVAETAPLRKGDSIRCVVIYKANRTTQSLAPTPRTRCHIVHLHELVPMHSLEE